MPLLWMATCSFDGDEEHVQGHTYAKDTTAGCSTGADSHGAAVIIIIFIIIIIIIISVRK